jgi:hypothetical protein
MWRMGRHGSVPMDAEGHMVKTMKMAKISSTKMSSMKAVMFGLTAMLVALFATGAAAATTAAAAGCCCPLCCC